MKRWNCPICFCKRLSLVLFSYWLQLLTCLVPQHIVILESIRATNSIINLVPLNGRDSSLPPLLTCSPRFLLLLFSWTNFCKSNSPFSFFTFCTICSTSHFHFSFCFAARTIFTPISCFTLPFINEKFPIQLRFPKNFLRQFHFLS